MEKEFRETIINLCEINPKSLVTGSRACKNIKAFLKKNEFTIDDLKAIWLEPEKTLGPFDKLPYPFRDSLSNAAHFHIQESYSLTSPILRILAYGPAAKLGENLVHLGWKIKENYLPRIGVKVSRWDRLILRLGRELILKSINLSGIFLRLFRFTGFYRAPFVHMLWKFAKVDPWNLIQDYIQNIPVDSRISPVFKCEKRRVMGCGLIGVDLLPSNGKLYFLESNFNAGHYIERHRLFPEGDTVCNHLAKWATENGFRNIIFYPTNFVKPFNWDLEQAWHEIVHKNNCRLQIMDDPFVGSPWYRQRKLFMDCGSDDTLYVNGRALESPITRLVAKKGLLESEIYCFNKTVSIDKEIPIPKIIKSQDEVPKTNEESRFPNIIVKNAIMDMTLGIRLYKTVNLPDNANTWPNITYEYVVPDLIVKEYNGVVEEFVYIFRAYMLITPEGPVYLGARKDISPVPIPKSLSFGLIKDKKPFITNINLGAYCVPHNEIEDHACKDAILSIGAVIFNFITKKHRLTINPC